MASGSSSKKNTDALTVLAAGDGVVAIAGSLWREGMAATKGHARQNPRTGTFNFSQVPPRRPSEW